MRQKSPVSRRNGGASQILFAAVGDSLTHGTRDAANNKSNARNAYLQRVYERLKDDYNLKFSQPYWNDREKRMNPYRIPTSLAVDGADVFSVDGREYGKRAGNPVTNDYRCERQLIRNGIDDEMTVRDFNGVIGEAVDDYGPEFQLVEVGSFLNGIFESGYNDGHVDISRRWGRGRGFCFDGVHGSHTAHALIASEVLHAVGDSGYSSPETHAIYDADPYRDFDKDGWVRGRTGGYSPKGLTRLLYLFQDADGESGSSPEQAIIDTMDPEDVWDMISDSLLDEIIDIPLIQQEAERRGFIPVRK